MMQLANRDEPGKVFDERVLNMFSKAEHTQRFGIENPDSWFGNLADHAKVKTRLDWFSGVATLSAFKAVKNTRCVVTKVHSQSKPLHGRIRMHGEDEPYAKLSSSTVQLKMYLCDSDFHGAEFVLALPQRIEFPPQLTKDDRRSLVKELTDLIQSVWYKLKLEIWFEDELGGDDQKRALVSREVSLSTIIEVVEDKLFPTIREELISLANARGVTGFGQSLGPLVSSELYGSFHQYFSADRWRIVQTQCSHNVPRLAPGHRSKVW
jgi:hypothetical protein